MDTQFDLIVVGGGMAGLNAAMRASEHGKRVAIVERDRVGGSCPIRGCIPTKALVRSAEIVHEARRADEFGIRIEGIEVDFAAVMDRVRAIIDKGATATRAWVEGLAGATLFTGEGRFVGPNTVAVGADVLRAERIVIATGAVPSVPPIAGLDATPYLTSDDVLQLTTLPRRLLIVGAGPIALELGQALQRLGSAVTMVEVQAALLPAEEPALADQLRDLLTAEGLTIHTGATIDHVAATGDGGAAITFAVDGVAQTVAGDALLIATGRAPDVESLDLAAAGVSGDRRGVGVDERLQTSSPGVYAAGDVLGRPWGAFTHVARRLGLEVIDNVFDLAPHDVDPDIGPRAIFTDPELASIGLTEQAARDAGYEVRVGAGTFRGGKARAWGEERGMVKVIGQAGTGRILGAHILAYHAADLLHPVAVAMSLGEGAVDAIKRTMHIHPTLGEVVKAAVHELA